MGAVCPVPPALGVAAATQEAPWHDRANRKAAGGLSTQVRGCRSLGDDAQRLMGATTEGFGKCGKAWGQLIKHRGCGFRLAEEQEGGAAFLAVP